MSKNFQITVSCCTRGCGKTMTVLMSEPLDHRQSMQFESQEVVCIVIRKGKG